MTYLSQPLVDVSAPTHRGLRTEHRELHHRTLLELNVSSLSDWPIACRRISFAYDERAQPRPAWPAVPCWRRGSISSRPLTTGTKTAAKRIGVPSSSLAPSQHRNAMSWRQGPDRARTLSVAVLLLLMVVHPGPAMAEPAAGKAAALQDCPAVEEEIVDLDLLAEGLKNSGAVGLLEKVRLRSAIDAMIGRMKAFHAGAKAYTLPQLQQQYDVLLVRIAAHLQHKDTVLHGQLCNAWEPIWRDLADAGS
jgi:hypothetical protein